MANEIWSKNSLINVSKDTPSDQSGTVTIENSSIILGVNSYVSYEYNYAATDTLIKTNSMLLEQLVRYTGLTRYTDIISITIRIQYWEQNEDETYTDGNYESLKVYPYSNAEDSSKESRQTQLEITNEYIKNIKITFSNESTEQIRIDSPTLLYNLDIEEIVSNIGTSDTPLESVDTYINGMVAYYKGDDMPVTIKVEQETNGMYIMNVSDRYMFSIVLHEGSMPWGGGTTPGN